MKRKVVLIIYAGIILFVILGVLFVKQWIFFKKAQNFEQLKNYIKATDCYVMVIYMHIPFSPFEKISIKRLLKIATICHREKNIKLEMYIYERLRSSIYGTRWFSTPHKDILNKIEIRLARIRAFLLKKANYPKNRQQIYKELIVIMQKDLAPDAFWSFVAVLSFFILTGCTILLIYRTSTEEAFFWKRALKILPGLMVIFFVWLLSLYLA